MKPLPLQRVIDGGYCIGCGACALAAPSAYTIRMDAFGCYQAVPAPQVDEIAARQAALVCPFADEAPNEESLAAVFLSEAGEQLDGVGRFLANFAGHVVEPGYRDRGSSGGMVSWIAHELLRHGLVDGVIHVKAATGSDPLFHYGISRHADDLFRDAKSKYYPVELSGVLADLERLKGRYAIIALPCFAKALRNLMRIKPELRVRLPYIIGLFCGHLKSARYAENYGWQLGIPGDALTAVDFRVKLPGQTANHYGIEVRGRTEKGEKVVRAENEKMFGANWGFGFFKYTACEYCDDVVAELADISIGDAWLEPYMSDHNGTNMIVVRRRDLLELVEAGIADGRLKVDRVAARNVVTSQASGLRHRREGLACRLDLKQRAGAWAPTKRVAPSNRISRKRRGIYRMRLELSEESHRAYRAAREAGSYELFRRRMEKLIDRYMDFYSLNRMHLFRRRVRRLLQHLLGERISAWIIPFFRKTPPTTP